jgi:type IV secretory pathway VirD2 relaxase
MADDDFTAWFGHLGDDRPFLHQVIKAANQAGRVMRPARVRARRFTGARIGRGSAVGRMLASWDKFGGDRARRVVVKARIVRLAGKGAKAAAAHLRYLQRDGTTRDGERGTLYGPDDEVIDGRAFLERGKGDRHQFRFIVSAEDGAQYVDLKPVTRRLMEQMEKDLGTRLEWIAVDHFNTGHPHTHIVLRGVDDTGQNLVIAREYISRGIAARAAEIVNLDLGPRTDRELALAVQREMDAERFTGIDRRLLQARNREGFVSAWQRDPAEQSLRAGRLRTLARMGLAREVGKGLYRLEDALEPRLREIGRRGDIVAVMDRELREQVAVRPADYVIFDPAKGGEIVGVVVAQGLADEHADRRYLIVEAVDGCAHYVELEGEALVDPVEDRLVRVAAPVPEVREADRTVAAVAAANGGSYSLDAHLRHDRSASPAFAEAHVRRLEAMRRSGGGVARQADGSWTIAPDHLERVEAWERGRTAKRPVHLEVVSDRPLDLVARYDGPTWLDEQCVAPEPERLRGRLGAKVQQALDLRRQWLIEQGLAVEEQASVRYQTDLIRALRLRELRPVARQINRDFGLEYLEHRGGRVQGTCRRAVEVGSSKYALIENAREFTLVPWRPELEKQIGRQVSGIDRGGTISWTFGRQRSGPER